jgi:hypothetical protein
MHQIPTKESIRGNTDIVIWGNKKKAFEDEVKFSGAHKRVI